MTGADLLREQGYGFYFYSHQPNEPLHVHIDKGGASLKAWLEPVELARNAGPDRARSVRVSNLCDRIACLLSNMNRLPLDVASPAWLGRHSNRHLLAGSGLCNQNHVHES